MRRGEGKMVRAGEGGFKGICIEGEWGCTRMRVKLKNIYTQSY